MIMLPKLEPPFWESDTLWITLIKIFGFSRYELMILNLWIKLFAAFVDISPDETFQKGAFENFKDSTETASVTVDQVSE